VAEKVEARVEVVAPVVVAPVGVVVAVAVAPVGVVVVAPVGVVVEQLQPRLLKKERGLHQPRN
jgi:hypothetical protein